MNNTNKEILCADFIKENYKYDPETGFIYKTKGMKSGKIVGGKAKNGYLDINVRFKQKNYSFKAHRIAWFLYYGYFPKYIDHINDKEKSNNKISNLREANCQQNNQNKSKQKKRKHSIYKGVSRISNVNNKWQAQIRQDKKLIYIGSFDNEIEAAKAYDKKAIELFGEFANLNFPII